MSKDFQAWAVPASHIPEHSPKLIPVVRRKERPVVRFLNEVYPVLFTIALLGLWLLFSLFKLAITALFALLDVRRELLGRLSKKKAAKKRVVIIGGGYAGTFAAVDLEHYYKVTLIEPKDFFEFTPSRLRSIVEPNHTARIQVEHSSILKRAKVVHDKVVRVADGEVFTEKGIGAIPYDYLIITSGSRYPDPHFPRTGEPPQRTTSKSVVERSSSGGSVTGGGRSSSKYGYTMIEQLSTAHLGDDYDDEPSHLLGDQLGDEIVLSARAVYFGDFYRQIRRASSILVIGGGTVGVEMAAEIREHFPTKHVIIINSPDHLLKNMPPRSIRYAEQWFRHNNVEMVLGDRVVSQDGKVFRTRNGREIRADLAFLCTGNVPNTEFLTNGGLPDPDKLVNQKSGLVRVNEFLQLQGYDNIFVAGDLTDIPATQEKLCQTAASEIKVVMSNIARSDAKRMMKRYRPKDCPMLISLGKYDGMLVYKSFTMTGFLPAVMKEFVEWKELVWYWSWSYFQPSHFRKTSLMDVRAPLPHAHVV
eukprot:TRINITY_DN3923_c1_g1_i1.p1 TRINITY_DN3923_c1_g1~~TRINITY_DN3923_c1_g1_i1.p1  ORF type:complete len:531 (+),score=176.40 TRINITY_DN3923_c1_g1_i1:159-1751(+)